MNPLLKGINLHKNFRVQPEWIKIKDLCRTCNKIFPPHCNASSTVSGTSGAPFCAWYKLQPCAGDQQRSVYLEGRSVWPQTRTQIQACLYNKGPSRTVFQVEIKPSP